MPRAAVVTVDLAALQDQAMRATGRQPASRSSTRRTPRSATRRNKVRNPIRGGDRPRPNGSDRGRTKTPSKGWHRVEAPRHSGSRNAVRAADEPMMVLANDINDDYLTDDDGYSTKVFVNPTRTGLGDQKLLARRQKPPPLRPRIAAKKHNAALPTALGPSDRERKVKVVVRCRPAFEDEVRRPMYRQIVNIQEQPQTRESRLGEGVDPTLCALRRRKRTSASLLLVCLNECRSRLVDFRLTGRWKHSRVWI